MDVFSLDKAIREVCPIVGVSGDGRIDFLPEATPEQRAEAQAIFDNWVDPPQPQWDAFLADFKTPGSNTLYASVVGKVGSAGFVVQDHWRNFVDVVNAHDIETLPGAIAYLAQLLSDAGQPLSTSDIDAWNTYMETYDFPDSCKLPAA